MDAKWLPRKATEEEMSNVQTEALRLAELVDCHSPIDFDGHLKQAAAELRRLSAVEQELEALKRAISDAEPVGFVTPETETVLKQFSGEDWCAIWNRETTKVSQPLYTLKGIK